MNKINYIIIFKVLIFLGVTQAGIMRITEKTIKSTMTTTKSHTTPLTMEAGTTELPYTTALPTQKSVALTRDEEASIVVAQQTLFEADPAELKSAIPMVQMDKSGRLLLLSTPKLSEKSKPAELAIDEREENAEEATQKAKEEEMKKPEKMNGVHMPKTNATTLPIPLEQAEHVKTSKDNDEKHSPMRDIQIDAKVSNLRAAILEHNESAEYIFLPNKVYDDSHIDIELYSEPVVEALPVAVERIYW